VDRDYLLVLPVICGILKCMIVLNAIGLAKITIRLVTFGIVVIIIQTKSDEIRSSTMEPGAAMTLWEMMYQLFWTPYNVLVVTGTWASVVLIGKIIPDSWVKVYRKHVVPAQYLVLCIAAVWTPDLWEDLTTRYSPPPEKLEGMKVVAESIKVVEPSSEISGVAILCMGVSLALCAYVFPIILLWAMEKWLPANVVKQIKKVLS